MNIWQQDIDEKLQGHNLITKIQSFLGWIGEATAVTAEIWALTGRTTAGRQVNT
jgi:hypothetical protein